MHWKQQDTKREQGIGKEKPQLIIPLQSWYRKMPASRIK